LKITVLGCGSSTGVPAIGCDCKVCKSDDPKNKRLRSSILIEDEGVSVLIDSTRDLRQQAIKNSITNLDGVIYTHAHFDHVFGLDDLRAYNFLQNAVMDIYADANTLDDLALRFNHVFDSPTKERPWSKPRLKANEIKYNNEFNIKDLSFMPFKQTHGKGFSTGIRAGDFVYSTDTNHLSDECFDIIAGVKVWIIDCLGYSDFPSHANLDIALSWIDRIKPELAVLTHMSHEIDYDDLKARLPDNIVPAYDGAVYSLSSQ